MADTTETPTESDAPESDNGDQPETPPPAEPESAEPSKTDDEPLGDGGKKALQAERSRATKAEKQAKALQTELDKLREAQMSETEKAIAQARREGAAEATTAVQRKLFAAETKVAASGKLADVDLLADTDVALKLLGLDEIPVTKSGDIDSEAISKAIDQLLADRPYLASTQQEQKPADPDFGAKPPATVLTGDDDARIDQMLRRAAGRNA